MRNAVKCCATEAAGDRDRALTEKVIEGERLDRILGELGDLGLDLDLRGFLAELIDQVGDQVELLRRVPHDQLAGAGQEGRRRARRESECPCRSKPAAPSTRVDGRSTVVGVVSDGDVQRHPSDGR